MLWLYPIFGQDPVGIPYLVDVSPCWTSATLTLTSVPPILTLDKSPIPGNTVQNFVNPQWLSIFANTYAANCPLIRVELLDNTGVALADSKITLINPTFPTASRIDIKTDVTFSVSIRLKAFTMAKNNYIVLNLRVCGSETLNLVSSATRSMIAGVEIGIVSNMADSTRYIIVT